MENKIKKVAIIGNNMSHALLVFNIAAKAAAEKIKLNSLSVKEAQKQLEIAGKKLSTSDMIIRLNNNLKILQSK
jgi:hypothetical protein